MGHLFPVKTLVDAGCSELSLQMRVHNESFLVCDPSELEGHEAFPGSLAEQTGQGVKAGCEATRNI